VGLGAGIRPAPTPLVFGIYPGGAAGTVGRSGRTAPELPAARLAALQRLRAPGRPFVLHLYANYTGPGSPAPAEQVGAELAGYAAGGFQTELVLTYRPADTHPEGDVPGFVRFVRDAVDTFGADPHFVGVQVTNEANVANAPNAADGYYPSVRDALIQGVIAASGEARLRRFGQVAVGFNWAYSLGPGESRFWRELGRRGGRAFARSLDWVGLDVYPGTWGPRAAAGGDLAASTTRTVLDALDSLRNRFMPLAGLSTKVALHVSENGYPTGPGRTEAMQAQALRSALGAVESWRSEYHITDYRWFDLRDADSSSAGFESRYGLMLDDYQPKAAFTVYRELIAKLG
jgi:hypothetical protein